MNNCNTVTLQETRKGLKIKKQQRHQEQPQERLAKTLKHFGGEEWRPLQDHNYVAEKKIYITIYFQFHRWDNKKHINAFQ